MALSAGLGRRAVQVGGEVVRRLAQPVFRWQIFTGPPRPLGPGSGETVAAFEHDGSTYEIDHLGIGSGSQWGGFAVYFDGEEVAESTLAGPPARVNRLGQPSLGVVTSAAQLPPVADLPGRFRGRLGL
jgi:hypothetical protein